MMFPRLHPSGMAYLFAVKPNLLVRVHMEFGIIRDACFADCWRNSLLAKLLLLARLLLGGSWCALSYVVVLLLLDIHFHKHGASLVCLQKSRSVSCSLLPVDGNVVEVFFCSKDHVVVCELCVARCCMRAKFSPSCIVAVSQCLSS